MEGRCAVETWTDFGLFGTSCKPKIRFGSGREVLFCTSSDEVFVFSIKERNLMVVLQFPGPVNDLVESQEKQFLYVACRSGVYCVNLQFLLSRVQSSSADASTRPTEVKISTDDLVVPEEVLALLIVGSVLLTLSQRDTSWKLSLYNSVKQSASSSYEMFASFSLPVVSGVLDNDTEKNRRTAVLTCVHCSDKTPTSSLETTVTDVHLEPVLFKLMFGIDAALVKSPVILCGLPDGRLCYLPMRLPESRLRVLHSLEQPVVIIGASCVMESGPAHAQCLVAVGELGRVVLVKKDDCGLEGGGSTAVFIERCVEGPVMCGCVDKNCLYYSTGSDLLRLDGLEGFSEREGQGSDDETSSKTHGALQTATSLNVCRILALAEPTCNTAGEVQLQGLTVRGQLQRITLPVRKEDANLSYMPSTQVGHGVKDILSAIGDVCERASALKTDIKSKKLILRQLNQVLNISSLLITNTNCEGNLRIQETAVRCHAITKWNRLLRKDSLNLTCLLDNSSPYVLERGWTLSISVFPLSYSPSATGESSSTNFSFPFHNLHPGETLEVALPLAAAAEESFPMTVSCSLVFSLSGLLGEDGADLLGPQSSCISLPLNTLTVDWLHALQVITPTDIHKKDTSRLNTTTDTIQAFLSSRRGWCSRRREGGRESSSMPEPELFSARVRISLALLEDTLMLKSSSLDPQEPKLAPQNVCQPLLEWLLSEGPGGVRTELKEVGGSVVHARGPNTHTVKMTAKELNVGGEESLAAVELQVESSSIATVCGLHHAVLRRVQALLQRAPKRAASTEKVQSLSLRQARLRAEHLLQQIQQTRVSGAFGVGGSTGQMTRSLLSVYRELRENPLVII